MFYEYVRGLAMSCENESANYNFDSECLFDELDTDFNLEELLQCTKCLKMGKFPGIDDVMNEYIITYQNVFAPILLRLFNAMLGTGYFPKLWARGMIVSVKKGDVNDTNNYRGITLISLVAKLFTSLLNNRLLQWSSRYNVVSDAQFGFKPGLGTRDAIFALQGLVTRTLQRGKRLFCVFVDYRKAFDRVTHTELWFKLARAGVRGKLLEVIKSMKNDVKSCV